MRHPAGNDRGRTTRTIVGLVAVSITAAITVLGAGLARGELTQQGNVIASFGGTISPHQLPRHRLAPVTVSLSGGLRTADGSPLPRLRTVELALAGSGTPDTRGLATCSPAQIVSATPAGSVTSCRDAQVGSGRLDIEVFIPGQRPFDFRASLRAFNGRLADGSPVIWLHVYGPDPPSTLVLPCKILHRSGAFATALVVTLPPDLGPLPHLTNFELTFGRRFTYRGHSHSYLNADCPVPPRFTAGFFPFARATYTLATGLRISTTIVRGCRAQGGRGR